MQDPRENRELMSAVQDYINSNGLQLDSRARFGWGIDCVSVEVDNHVVLWISLPPLSNYGIHETEYTDKYLRKTA